ncbi:MAG: US12 family protein, partial [Lachnospiraceae bacterium]|nr:US12 family protein [Lachnospiraceae bacterium]
FFLSIGRVLIFALIGSIVIELIGGLLLHLPLGIMDYVVVVIFAGYIGYDWARAQAYPKTLDNAIDSAADIYVDIINIFIRILSIIGKKDN